jgi:hypothetical protein
VELVRYGVGIPGMDAMTARPPTLMKICGAVSHRSPTIPAELVVSVGQFDGNPECHLPFTPAGASMEPKRVDPFTWADYSIH